MSSSDTTAPFVRTTGLEVTEGSASRREAVLDSEVQRLRGKVAALRDELDARDERIAELETELAHRAEELDNAREWAEFLDREVREHRERVETLEDRVAALEAQDENENEQERERESGPEPTGLLDRLRALF